MHNRLGDHARALFALCGFTAVAGLTLLLISASAPADPSAAVLAPDGVSAGTAHTCAIRANGTIACWGDDSAGQLDEIPSGEFRAISAGGAHTCAIRGGGEVACWGDNSAGQLDEIPGGLFRAISAGGAHTCAIHGDGTLACWGDDSAGQLDDVPPGEYRAVSAGGAHTCAVRGDSELLCWGDDSSGQVSGVPSGETAARPYHLHKHHNDRHHHHDKDDPPEPEPISFIAVGAGDEHTCAVESGGELDCWGDESGGQMEGMPEGTLLAVSAGGAHSCAIRASGALACWGGNGAGQLDDVPAGAFLAASAGGAHSCAIDAGSDLDCWGDNGAGQVQPQIVGPEPPPGETGAAYSHTFATTPQSPAPTFFLAAGAPPPGLELAADGELAGTPTEAGTFVFTVAAANGLTPDAEREVTLEIVSAPAPPAAVALAPEVDNLLPPPTRGVNFNLEPVNGVSRVRCSDDKGFSVLTEPQQVPIDCQVDARKGVVKVTTATGEGDGTQSSYFWGGHFTVSQEAKTNWETDLHLAGRLRCEKRAGGKNRGARASRRKSKRARRRGGRKLWGSGRGRYKTSGNYGSATVRGTVWLVRDRCDNSTLFKVRRGFVTVEDFVKDIKVTLRRGKRYVARSAIPRLR